MWRAVVEAAGPFLIPFALYALWLAAMKRADPAAAGGEDAGQARAHPWVLLSIAGLILAFAVLVFTSTRERMATGSHYAPARIEDGRILPGGPAPR